MINYIFKGEIDGILIQLIYSQEPDKFYTIYGLENQEHDTITDARAALEDILNHAFDCGDYADW